MVVGKSGLYFSWQAFYFERPGHAEEYAQRLKRINGLGHMESEPQPMPYRGSFWNRLGFGSHGQGVVRDSSGSFNNRSYYRYSFDGCHIPYWFLLLLFACAGLPLVLRLRAQRRRSRRLRANQCLSCGYDLRATTGRCPECGQLV
jgi:hypothetical protein